MQFYCLFAGNEKLAKDFLTGLYYNLLVEILSKDNQKILKFDALTDLCTKIGVRLGNAIFANHERARLDMKNQNKEISKKFDFFIDDDDKIDVKIKFGFEKKSMKIEVGDVIETIPYLSPKNEFKKDDDADTILYASLYNSPSMEVMKKYMLNQNLKLSKKLKKKLQKRG